MDDFYGRSVSRDVLSTEHERQQNILVSAVDLLDLETKLLTPVFSFDGVPVSVKGVLSVVDFDKKLVDDAMSAISFVMSTVETLSSVVERVDVICQSAGIYNFIVYPRDNCRGFYFGERRRNHRCILVLFKNISAKFVKGSKLKGSSKKSLLHLFVDGDGDCDGRNV